jgi:hypothetical protein
MIFSGVKQAHTPSITKLVCLWHLVDTKIDFLFRLFLPIGKMFGAIKKDITTNLRIQNDI